MPSPLDAVRRYQQAMESARTVIDTLIAARLEVAAQVAASTALRDTAANARPWR